MSWWGCGEKGILCTVCRNVNWCSHYGKQCESSSKNWKYNCPMIQQFHFWVYIWKKWKQNIKKDICSLMLIASLFTMAKTWKQPVSVNGWTDKDVVYAHNEILSRKKERNPPFVTTWTDLEGIMLWHKSEKDKYYNIRCHLQEESKKAELLKTV